MKKQKRKNQELLDEVVFEFVLCMFRDLVHITVLFILKYKYKHDCSKCEDFVTENSSDSKCIESSAIRLARLSKNLLKGVIKLCYGRIGIVFFFEHAKYEYLSVMEQTNVKSSTKTNKEMIPNTILLSITLVLVCLKCAVVNYWSMQELSLPSNAFHIDIEFSSPSGYLYCMIDETSDFHNMNGISFIHFPRVSRNFESDILVSESGRPQTSILKSSCHTVLVSNSTATGTLFSLENKLMNRFVLFVYRMFFYAMMLVAPLMVSSSPIQDETLIQEKETKSRERRSSTLRSFVVPLKGAPNTGYCADMEFGDSVSSTQEFCVLVDTGSSNLAVAAVPLPEIKEHLNTQLLNSSLVLTEEKVTVSYSGGEWSGTLAREQVSIGGSQPTPVEVEFALIQSASTFFIPGAEWVGILGLAYDSLAKPDSSVTPFWSTLQKSSGLPDMFAIRICPPLDSVNKGGILEFGDTSDTLYTGPIFYTEIVQELYYNVLVTSLTVGSVKIDLPCYQFNNDKAIVDSGTTDIYLPTETFDAIVTAFKAHFEELPLEVPDDFWKGELKLSWPSESIDVLFEAFPVFFIGLATQDDSSKEFALAVTPQIYLRQVPGSREEMNEAKCSPHCSFFVFGIKSRDKGMVIGGNVMLGFTTVFDREGKRVGFAKSTCNYNDVTPGHIPYIVGPYARVPVDCECHGCSYTPAYWELIVYTCGGIVSLLCLISTLHTIVAKIQKRRNRFGGRSLSCCCRRNTIRATNVVATEETDYDEEVSPSSLVRLKPPSLVSARRPSTGSVDSGFDSPQSSLTSSGYASIPSFSASSVEEENQSTAASYVSSTFSNGACKNDVELLKKSRHVVHTLVPRLASILVFCC